MLHIISLNLTKLYTTLLEILELNFEHKLWVCCKLQRNHVTSEPFTEIRRHVYNQKDVKWCERNFRSYSVAPWLPASEKGSKQDIIPIKIFLQITPCSGTIFLHYQANGRIYTTGEKPVEDWFPVCDEFPGLIWKQDGTGLWWRTRPNLPVYLSVWVDEFCFLLDEKPVEIRHKFTLIRFSGRVSGENSTDDAGKALWDNRTAPKWGSLA